MCCCCCLLIRFLFDTPRFVKHENYFPICYRSDTNLNFQMTASHPRYYSNLCNVFFGAASPYSVFSPCLPRNSFRRKTTLLRDTEKKRIKEREKFVFGHNERMIKKIYVSILNDNLESIFLVFWLVFDAFQHSVRLCVSRLCNVISGH